MRIFFAVLSPCLFAGVLAWGAEGHEAVGRIAQSFLTSDALAFVTESLDASFDGQLSKAATWPDVVRHHHGWEWSAPLHFVDANDRPLEDSCSLEQVRDCSNNMCILSAIANYTERVADPGLPKEQISQALSFVTHFLGDVTQPLHCEGVERGGNSIKVVFDGHHTNLHAVWDTSIPEKTIKTSFDGSVEDWADSLASRIQGGDYASQASQWISCSDPRDRDVLEGQRQFVMLGAPFQGYLKCPQVWAIESNLFCCSNVFQGYQDSDLGTDYYEAQKDVVDLQIARGGYRLAAWLNAIVAEAPSA